MSASRVLYADYGCPFAHRVQALLGELAVPWALHLVPLGGRVDDDCRVPRLVDDDLVLTESRVINEYLAERFDYERAYPAGLRDRARHKHAIALVDEHVAPGLFRTLDAGELDKLRVSLDVFERAMAADGLSLFALHIAPCWVWLRQMRPSSAMVAAIAARPGLRRWLDRLAEHPSIAATAPDPGRVRAEFDEARAAGLIAPSTETSFR